MHVERKSAEPGFDDASIASEPVQSCLHVKRRLEAEDTEVSRPSFTFNHRLASVRGEICSAPWGKHGEPPRQIWRSLERECIELPNDRRYTAWEREKGICLSIIQPEEDVAGVEHLLAGEGREGRGTL